MNKLIKALTIFCLCACAQVRAVDTNINPLNIARAFAIKAPTYFQCTLQGYSVVSNVLYGTTMKFTVRKSDFAITNLVINGQQIPLPKPIYGLPMGDSGVMVSVWLNVAAFTKHGEYAGNGYLDEPVITKDDNLIVVVRPSDIQQEIHVGPDVNLDDLQLEIENFPYGYGYGPSNGKFYVYLPPIGGKYHYILKRRSDGIPVGEGWIEPFKTPMTPTNMYFGAVYEGNVQSIEFPTDGIDSWAGYPLSSLDCSVPTDTGTNIAGKVYFSDIGAGNLAVMMGGHFQVYVYRALDSGDMTLVPLEDHSAGTFIEEKEIWFETRVNTTGGNIGKVVIVVVPTNGFPFRQTWINLHRFIGPFNIGNGGGMGAPIEEDVTVKPILEVAPFEVGTP